MYTKSREEEVKLLKRLWTAQPTMCPKCGNAELEHLHKNAKKSNVNGSVQYVAKYIERLICLKNFQMNRF